jgi:hypothetical protein
MQNQMRPFKGRARLPRIAVAESPEAWDWRFRLDIPDEASWALKLTLSHRRCVAENRVPIHSCACRRYDIGAENNKSKWIVRGIGWKK